MILSMRNIDSKTELYVKGKIRERCFSLTNLIEHRLGVYDS